MLSYFHRLFLRRDHQRINRYLNGEIAVSIDQDVLPHEVLGSNRKPTGFRIFHLDQILNCPPTEASNYLRKRVGTQIFKGELVAERNSFANLKKYLFRMPVDGIIKNFNRENGQLTIEYLPQLLKVPSGVEGKVIEIKPGEKVVIESQALILRGRAGIGVRREGTLSVLPFFEIPLPPSAINEEQMSKIVVAGSFVTREVLYKLISVKAKGLIVGGMDYNDYREIAGSGIGKEDIGLTILVVGGFGSLPLDQEKFKMLQTLNGSQAIICGDWKKLMIPLKSSFSLNSDFSDKIARNIFYPVISPGIGARVRILGLNNFGFFGTIEKLSSEEKIFGSGIQSQFVSVRLDNKDLVDLPYENIEVVD